MSSDALKATTHKKILDNEALLNAAGSLIVVFDQQGKIQRFNRTCEVITGYTESEVKSHCVWDFLLVSEERIAMQGLFRQLVNGQTNTYYESTWLGKAGERHVIAWSNTILKAASGDVEFIVSSGIEVTEQRRSRRYLEGQYRQSHLLAEMTQKIRQSLDLDSILQVAVSEVHGLLGCDRVFILKAPAGDDVQLAAKSLSEVPDAISDSQPSARSLLQSSWPFNPLLNANYVDHYRQLSVSVLDTVGGRGTAPEIVDILNSLSVKSELVVPILTAAPPDNDAEGRLRASSPANSLVDDLPENSPSPVNSNESLEKKSTENPEELCWGLLVAHQCVQSRRWKPWEIELMQQLANQMGVAINHAELLDHLEDSVQMRTAELTATNQQLRREMNERMRTETALRRSEQQLRLITNALPALVAYIDSHHRYRFNNYAYELWYDIPYQQIKGRQVSDIVSLEVYQQMLPYLEQALSGEKVTYEAEMIRSSGDRLWASVSYIPDIQENRVKGLFSLVSDISDRKATERMKDEFVSVVSHELRTPLTSVHGSLKLLATGRLGALNTQGQALLDIALKNTERLTRLLNDVLDLERMGSGRVQLMPVACDVPDLLQSAAEAMQSMADEYGIRLAVKTLPEPETSLLGAVLSSSASAPLEVCADPDQVMQALTN
ncbi:MAG: PAS domain S-box protein, partial [Cyanobacteria bacterium J06632_3]